VELLYGIWTNSLGLISDACHMMFDSFALAIGLYAAVISKWEPTKTFSYGFGRVQVLSGYVNAVFLMFIAFFISLEAIERFLEPEEIKSERLLLVSVLGLLVNLIGLFAFHSHGGHDHHPHQAEEGHAHHDHDHAAHHDHEGHNHHHDHHHHHHGGDDNLMGVYLHVLADTMGSVGVIISSSLVHYLGWTIADPIASFCISLMIFLSAVPLLRSSAQTLLQRVPRSFERSLRSALAAVSRVEGVLQCREVHCWSHAAGLLVCTVTVQLRQTASEPRARAAVLALLKEHGIAHVAVQIEKELVNPVTGVPMTLTPGAAAMEGTMVI